MTTPSNLQTLRKSLLFTTVGLIWCEILSGCGMMTGKNSQADLGKMPFPLRGLSGATTNLTFHPFGNGVSSRSLELFSSGRLTFADAVNGLVGEQLGNGMHLQLEQVELPSLAAAGGQRYEGTFSVNGVPVFGTQVVANLLNDRSPLLFGTMPSVTAAAVAAASTTWPDLEATKSMITGRLTLPGTDTAFSLGSPQRYYVAAATGELRPSWKMTAKIGNLPYDVVADQNGIVSFSKRFFEASGTATIYPNNALDTSTISYALKDLSSNGTLTSPYLTTVIPSGYTQANSTSGNFNYPKTDPRFIEANAYSHTDEHFRWLLGIGGKTYGDLPINIQLHYLFDGGNPNNALFVPGDLSTGDPFEIEIGDGDGTTLANLPTDWDVPSHESGHYFVYNYLKWTQDESLGVHEGLADLFVYLNKGVKGLPKAACLGPSICPANSTLCIESGCLRTDDNTWAYMDAHWQAWTAQLEAAGSPCCAHKHGQVLGGVVWDLVKNNDMSAADAANLTMTAITYFKIDSGIRDYLLSLLTADKAVFACKYDTQLRKYIAARNLTTLIKDVQPGCSNIPSLSGTGEDLVDSNANTSTSGTSKPQSCLFGLCTTSCGRVPGTAEEHPWMLVLIGLAPVAVALKRRVV